MKEPHGLPGLHVYIKVMKIIMLKCVDIKVCVYLIMNEYHVIVDYEDFFLMSSSLWVVKVLGDRKQLMLTVKGIFT